jgi:cytochrome c oxidase subunit 2
MNPVGATISDTVDNIFIFIVVVSVVLLLLVTTLMIYFAIKYNRKRHPEPKPVKQRLWLEVLWTVIPTILVLAMFFYGYEGFKLMREVPEDAMAVKVTGRMWDWKFEYANGKQTDKLYVPVGKNIKLLLKSLDVVHSFYIPAHRVKEDVVPGLETYLWFKPQAIGNADIYCAEFCGQRHAYMLSQVVAMKEEDFNAWYGKEEKKEESPVVALMEELGCLDCHSLDDSAGDRLSLYGIFGKTRTVIKDGKEIQVTADEEYIRRAIVDPKAELLKDNPLDMEMEVTEDITTEQVEQIVQFLKSGPGTSKTEKTPESTQKEEKKQEQKQEK